MGNKPQTFFGKLIILILALAIFLSQLPFSFAAGESEEFLKAKERVAQAKREWKNCEKEYEALVKQEAAATEGYKKALKNRDKFAREATIAKSELKALSAAREKALESYVLNYNLTHKKRFPPQKPFPNEQEKADLDEQLARLKRLINEKKTEYAALEEKYRKKRDKVTDDYWDAKIAEVKYKGELEKLTTQRQNKNDESEELRQKYLEIIDTNARYLWDAPPFLKKVYAGDSKGTFYKGVWKEYTAEEEKRDALIKGLKAQQKEAREAMLKTRRKCEHTAFVCERTKKLLKDLDKLYKGVEDDEFVASLAADGILIMGEIILTGGASTVARLAGNILAKSLPYLTGHAINMITNSLVDSETSKNIPLIPQAKIAASAAASQLVSDNYYWGEAVKKAMGRYYPAKGLVDIEVRGLRGFAVSFGAALAKDVALGWYFSGIKEEMKRNILAQEMEYRLYDNMNRSFRTYANFIEAELIKIVRTLEAKEHEAEEKDTRELRRETKEIEIEDGYKIHLSVWFSRPVGMPQGTIGQETIKWFESDVEHKEDWSGTVVLKDAGEYQDKEIPMVFDARDETGRRLDADPSTVAIAWRKEACYEEAIGGKSGAIGGADRWHYLNSNPAGGNSVMIVMDYSGSMRGEKINQAISSLDKLLEGLEPQDEIALVIFYQSSVSLVRSFTRNKDNIKASIMRREPEGSTPLAKAIRYGGDYLLSQGKYKNKILVVLSDGEETEDGNPYAEMRKLSERGVGVR